MSRTTVEDQRHDNALRVLQALREHGPATRAELARQAGLGRAGVSRLVHGLLRDGVLREQAGATRQPVDLNTGANYVLGFDVGGTHFRAGLANIRGDILAEARAPSVYHTGQPDYGEVFARLRDHLARASRIDPGEIRAAGASVAATIEPGTGWVVLCPNISAGKFDLRARMEEALGLPVRIENDVNLAAVGEHWKGVARDARNFIFLAVGTGIGGGVFIDGKLYLGAHNAAGEVGYMYVHGIEQMGEDRLGVLERRASGPAIAMAAREMLRSAWGRERGSTLAGHEPKAITSEDVWAAARQGDPVAARVIDDTLDTLALGLADAAMMLDPELIVLGGGVAREGDALLFPLRERLAALLPYPIMPRLELSTLGPAAQLYGAIRMALDQVDAGIANSRSSGG